MVIHGLHAHALHEPVGQLCRRALEERVCRAFAAHTVDNVTTAVIFSHHLGDDLDIVLQVSVNRDDCISIGTGGVQSCHEGVLMSHIAREFETTHMGIVLAVGSNHLPRAVARAVVDIEHIAGIRHQSVTYHAVEQFTQLVVGLGQHFLFIEAWHHYRQN